MKKLLSLLAMTGIISLTSSTTVISCTTNTTTNTSHSLADMKFKDSNAIITGDLFLGVLEQIGQKQSPAITFQQLFTEMQRQIISVEIYHADGSPVSFGNDATISETCKVKITVNDDSKYFDPMPQKEFDIVVNPQTKIDLTGFKFENITAINGSQLFTGIYQQLAKKANISMLSMGNDVHLHTITINCKDGDGNPVNSNDLFSPLALGTGTAEITITADSFHFTALTAISFDITIV